MNSSRARVVHVGASSPPASLDRSVTVEDVEVRVTSAASLPPEPTDGVDPSAEIEPAVAAVAAGADCVVVRASAGEGRPGAGGDVGTREEEAIATDGEEADEADEADAAGVPGQAVVEAIRAVDRTVPIVYATPEPDGIAAGAVTRAGASEYLVTDTGDGPTVADRIEALVDPEAPGDSGDTADAPDDAAEGSGAGPATPDSGRSTVPSLEALQGIESELADEADTPFADRLERVLDAGRTALEVEYAGLAEVEGEQYELRAVVGEDDAVAAGITLPLAETFCERAIEMDAPLSVGSVGDRPELADRGVHRHAGIECYLGAPVVVDGDVWGSLCFFGCEERPAFSAWDETVVELLAEWVGYELGTRARRTDVERARSSLGHTLERIDDAFVALDEEWRFTYLNGRAQELLNPADRDLVGANVWEHFPERICDQVETPCRRALADQETAAFEVYDASIGRWYDVRAYPSETGLSIYFNDVTDRKARERELERYEVIVEAIDDGVAVVDEDHRFAQVNEAAASLAGLDREELLGRSAAEFVPDAAWEELLEIERVVAADGPTTATVETELERATGDRLPVEASVTRLERDGRALDRGFVGVVRDVSERTEREETVRQLLSTTRALFACDTAAEIAETVTDAAADVFGFEYASVRLLDADADDLVLESATGPAAELYGDRTRVPLDEAPMGEPLRTGEPVVFEDLEESAYDYGHLREAIGIPIGTDGLLTVCSPRTDTFGEADVQLAQLLTANAEAAFEGVDRRETLVRYERVLEAVEGMVYALDEEGRFTLVTDPLADRLGYERDELVGEHASILLDREDVDRAVSCIRTLLSDPERTAITYEAPLRSAVGAEMPAEIEMSLLGADEGFAGTVGAVRDITERKERERYLQVLNRVLRHNLRNDLTVVMGYAEQLTQRVEDDSLAETAETLREVSADLAELSEDAKRIERTLRRGRVEGYPVELDELVSDVVDRNRWDRQGARIDVDVPADAAAVADDELATALVHLVENAIEHNPAREPTVRISARTSGRTVTLAVGDDGPGIPPSERGVITGDHDITQLTHGSGLGLWLVRWIVDSYGGRIEFTDSELGGSRVEIVLEAATAMVAGE